MNLFIGQIDGSERRRIVDMASRRRLNRSRTSSPARAASHATTRDPGGDSPVRATRRATRNAWNDSCGVCAQARESAGNAGRRPAGTATQTLQADRPGRRAASPARTLATDLQASETETAALRRVGERVGQRRRRDPHSHSRNVVGDGAFIVHGSEDHEFALGRDDAHERCASPGSSTAYSRPIAGNSMQTVGGPPRRLGRTTGPQPVDRSIADGLRRSAAPWPRRRREARRLRRGRRDKRAPRAGARAG